MMLGCWLSQGSTAGRGFRGLGTFSHSLDAVENAGRAIRAKYGF
jgi:hypothetical protein